MKLIILLLGISFSQISFATCGNPENILVYANGMFNEKWEAQKNLDSFRVMHINKYPNTPIHLSHLAYNTSESLLVQVYEVYTQYISSTGEAFWSNVAKVYPYAHNNLKDSISDQTARDADLAEQIQTYQDFINKRYSVVTVAHSQGNFYTLSAFNYLETPATKMVSVATPAQAVYRDGPYFTFTTDPIGDLTPLALEPNIQKAAPSAFDHGFMTHYMNDAKARSLILEATNKALSIPLDNQFIPSLDEHDGYFNSDMRNVLRWTQKTMLSGASNEAEGLLLQSIEELNHASLSCESRNYNELIKRLLQKANMASTEGLTEALAILKSLKFTEPKPLQK